MAAISLEYEGIVFMLQTSHDGIDATSITSGIENEIKKAGANFSKMKKSSIKRKVQNFSHESDEGIIEPLLQIEKEKAEIVNKSAKFLLNKSKIDSSYERVNKSSDNFALSGSTLSTPPSKVISATLKDSQSSTSYICGTAPMHNHMNTNVFSTYDVSKGIPAPKNQILVEIDGCKPGNYNPSPLIFTTAKIHTDSKSKLMEPVQTTPVPILSTIEGNVVKTLTNNSERHVNSLPTKSVDQIITNKTSKLDTNELQSDKGKAHISTTVTTVSSKKDDISLKEVTNLNECKNKNVKDAPETRISQNTGITTTGITKNNTKSMLPTTKNSSNLTTPKNMKDVADSLANNKLSTDSAPVSTNSSTETSISYKNQTTLSEMSLLPDKNKSTALIASDNEALKSNVQPVDLLMEDNKSIYLKQTKESHCDDNVTSASKISPLPGKLTNDEMTRAVKLKESIVDDKRDDTNTFKTPIASASKKLQRQKNAAVNEINETNNIFSSFSVEKSSIAQEFDKKFITNNEKVSSCKGDYKRDGTYSSEKFSTGTKSSPINETRPTTTPSLPKSIDEASSKSKVKLTTEVTHVSPVTFTTFEDVTKTQTKSSIVSTTPSTKNNTNITSVVTIKSQSSSKACTGNTSVMETFSKPDKSSNDTVVPTTSKYISSVKCDSTTASTTLPLYIVSTSKTKIGSTLTTDTLKNTTKSSSQQPFAEIVYTSTETEKTTQATKLRDGSTLITSSSSSANHSNFTQQTKTKTDTCFKDGRV
ncbi:uncharacterized protein LOC123670388 [Melitaea cinxia]|uniref:uncharacterized protein LOC123670388 n=1 Tax=Melitaea cinxia TaxID=113334 RepID=UPI001E270A6C|nr:uncharacterized protein LOC123670388 [Melitaea cinxia]